MVSGDLAAGPFDVRLGIVDAEFTARLHRLRAAVDGWLAWSEVAGRVVHIPGNEWQQQS